MDLSKRQKLEAKGWKIGEAEEFLELNLAESLLVKTILLVRRIFAPFL